MAAAGAASAPPVAAEATVTPAAPVLMSTSTEATTVSVSIASPTESETAVLSSIIQAPPGPSAEISVASSSGKTAAVTAAVRKRGCSSGGSVSEGNRSLVQSCSGTKNSSNIGSGWPVTFLNCDTRDFSGGSTSNSKPTSCGSTDSSSETQATSILSRSKHMYPESDFFYKGRTTVENYCNGKEPYGSSSSNGCKEEPSYSCSGSHCVCRSATITDSSSSITTCGECRRITADRRSSSNSSGHAKMIRSQDACSTAKCPVRLVRKECSIKRTGSHGENNRCSSNSCCSRAAQLLPREADTEGRIYERKFRRSGREIASVTRHQQQQQQSSPIRLTCPANAATMEAICATARSATGVTKIATADISAAATAANTAVAARKKTTDFSAATAAVASAAARPAVAVMNTAAPEFSPATAATAPTAAAVPAAVGTPRAGAARPALAARWAASAVNAHAEPPACMGDRKVNVISATRNCPAAASRFSTVNGEGACVAVRAELSPQAEAKCGLKEAAAEHRSAASLRWSCKPGCPRSQSTTVGRKPKDPAECLITQLASPSLNSCHRNHAQQHVPVCKSDAPLPSTLQRPQHVSVSLGGPAAAGGSEEEFDEPAAITAPAATAVLVKGVRPAVQSAEALTGSSYACTRGMPKLGRSNICVQTSSTKRSPGQSVGPSVLPSSQDIPARTPTSNSTPVDMSKITTVKSATAITNGFIATARSAGSDVSDNPALATAAATGAAIAANATATVGAGLPSSVSAISLKPVTSSPTAVVAGPRRRGSAVAAPHAVSKHDKTQEEAIGGEVSAEGCSFNVQQVSPTTPSSICRSSSCNRVVLAGGSATLLLPTSGAEQQQRRPLRASTGPASVDAAAAGTAVNACSATPSGGDDADATATTRAVSSPTLTSTDAHAAGQPDSGLMTRSAALTGLSKNGCTVFPAFVQAPLSTNTTKNTATAGCTASARGPRGFPSSSSSSQGDASGCGLAADFVDARAAASAALSQRPTASRSAGATSEYAAGGFGCSTAAVSVSSFPSTMQVPPPFPPLPVTCGVSPPAETVLLRDLQMLRLQRVLRTAATQGAKNGQHQQCQASKVTAQQQPHGAKNGQHQQCQASKVTAQQQQHGAKNGQHQQCQASKVTAQQQQHGAMERSTPQHDPAWLKNFSGWVLLQLPPSSAALARALATVKGPQQRHRRVASDASPTATRQKKGGEVRNAGRRAKTREGGVVAVRPRAASVAAVQTIAKVSTAGSGTSNKAVATGKTALEEINNRRGYGGPLQRRHQSQVLSKSQSSNATRQRLTCSSSKYFTCTPAAAVGEPAAAVGEPAAAANTSSKLASGFSQSPRGIDHDETVRDCDGHQARTNSSTSSMSVTNSRNVSSPSNSGSHYSRTNVCDIATVSKEIDGREDAHGYGRSKKRLEGERSRATGAAETALSLLEAEVYMSRQTLLQTSGPRLSGFIDHNGKSIRVQRHVIEQIIASAAPRFIFEQFYSQGVPSEPSLARYLEKRRIQSTLRRLKEHIEMKLQEDASAASAPAEDFGNSFRRLATAAATHCPSACSIITRGEGSRDVFPSATGRAGAGSSSLDSSLDQESMITQLEIQQQGLYAGLEALDWWAPGLNEQDKKEIFFAVATSGFQQETAETAREIREEKPLPRSINNQAWISVFRYLPFNLPDWPVPSSAFPTPSERSRPLLPFLAVPSRGEADTLSLASDSSSSPQQQCGRFVRGRRSSSTLCGGCCNRHVCTCDESSFHGSISTAAESTGSADTIEQDGIGSSVESISSAEWTETPCSNSTSSSIRGTQWAPRCSRYFVLNKPQSVFAVAAVAARRTKRLVPCGCRQTGKQQCFCPQASLASSAVGEDEVKPPNLSRKTLQDGPMAAHSNKSWLGGSSAVAASPTAEEATHATPPVTDSKPKASVAAGTLPQVCDAPLPDEGRRLRNQQSMKTEISDRRCVHLEGCSGSAAGAAGTNADAFTGFDATSQRCEHKIPSGISSLSSTNTCLCGVLHLCRVALLICEAFCEPISYHFPNFLQHLISIDDIFPSLSSAGRRRHVPKVKNSGLTQSSFTQASVADMSQTNTGSSTDINASLMVAAAAAAAASKPTTATKTSDTRGHNPCSGAAILSGGAKMDEQCQRSRVGNTTDSETSLLGNTSNFTEQTRFLSKQQGFIRNETKQQSSCGSATSNISPSAETQGGATVEADACVFAAVNRKKLTEHIQSQGALNDQVEPPKKFMSTTSISSFPSSSLSCFVSPKVIEGSLITKPENSSWSEATAGAPCVISPYPPSRPLLCLMTHSAAAQQHAQLTGAPHSQSNPQTRGEKADMREVSTEPKRLIQNFAVNAANDTRSSHLLQQQHAQQARRQLLQHHQQRPAWWQEASCQQLQHQQPVDQQRQPQRRTPPHTRDECTGSATVPTELSIPIWHLEQDFLLSRLVSLEEVQGALRVLLPAGWVLAGLQLLIGAATAALSPLEWLSLLHPCSSVASSIDIGDVVSRFNTLHPLSICAVCCSLPAVPSSSSLNTQTRLSHFQSTSSHVGSCTSIHSSTMRPTQQSSSVAYPHPLSTLAALVSLQQRRVERMCSCSCTKKRLYSQETVNEDCCHGNCLVTHQCVAGTTSTSENGQHIPHDKPPASDSQHIHRSAAGPHGSVTAHPAAASSPEGINPCSVAFTPRHPSALTSQQCTTETSEDTTKQKQGSRSTFFKTPGEDCYSAGVSRARTRSGKTCGVICHGSRQNTWAHTRDSRSRLGLHWWSFLSLEDKSQKREDTHEPSHAKKCETSAIRGQSHKELRPRGGASSTMKARSRTCSRRRPFGSEVDTHEGAQNNRFLNMFSETQLATTGEFPVCGSHGAARKERVLMSEKKQDGPQTDAAHNRSMPQCADSVDTRDNVRQIGNSISGGDGCVASALETNNTEELATQVSIMIQLYVESLYASDKARKAFEKLSAAALSSSVIELGMPAGGVDTLVSLVRTGGSCCFDLYAVIACCKLFFHIFKNAHVFQVLHDLT